MGFRQWEDEVELFEVVEGHLVGKIDLPFTELPFSHFDTEDSTVSYGSSRDRNVFLRVLGFTANTNNPMVFASVTNAEGGESVRRGELIGCRHPEERVILPKILRTHYMPVIHEIGQNVGTAELPTPIKRLRAEKSQR